MRDDESALKAATKVTLVYGLGIAVSMALTFGAVALGWPFWAILTVLLVTSIGSGILTALYIIKKG